MVCARHNPNSGAETAFMAPVTPTTNAQDSVTYDLRDTKIKVNSVSPGFVATDMNNHTGTDAVEEGAIAIVHLAQLPDDGPTESFIHKTAHTPGSCNLS